jgi:RNA polymerase sigma-70 factor (ECF subfamily)
VDATDRAYDFALLERAAQGDQRAFREIVERHQRKAHAVAFGLVRNPEDAREVVQEAFLRVFRHLQEFAGQASFSTWLYRIVVNLAIDMLRKRAPGQMVELEDHTELDGAPDELLPMRGAFDPQDALGRKRLVLAMQEALDKLPPYHRAVILLRELEGMSYEEMAQTLDVSKGTIMSRLFHARRKMQVMLREALGDEVPLPESEGEPEGAAPRRRERAEGE